MATYDTLKEDVADWIHRTDLDSKMDTFVLLAESQINKDLRAIEMEKRLAVTFTDTFYDFPDDFLELRSMNIESNGARIPLKQVSPQYINELYVHATGTPRAYALHGGQMELRPGFEAPVEYNGELSYYASVPSLTINTTNDILDKYQLVYLCAMMVQANNYVQDDDEMRKWMGFYSLQIDQANKQANNARYVSPSVRGI